MFLRHCAKCTNSNCNYGASCTTGKDLWNHITNCKDQNCNYPRCLHSRNLLRHYQKCESAVCPICVPIKQAPTEAGTASSMYTPQNGYIAQPNNGMVSPMQIPGHSMGMTVAPRQNSGLVPMQPAPPAAVPEHGPARPRSDVPVLSSGMDSSVPPVESAGMPAQPSIKRQRADMDQIKV